MAKKVGWDFEETKKSKKSSFKREFEKMNWTERLDRVGPSLDLHWMYASTSYQSIGYTPDCVGRVMCPEGEPDFPKMIWDAHEANRPVHVYVKDMADGYMSAAYMGLQSIHALGSTFGWNSLFDKFDATNEFLPDLRYHPVDMNLSYDDLVREIKWELKQNQEHQGLLNVEAHLNAMILGIEIPDIQKFLEDCGITPDDHVKILILNPVEPKKVDVKALAETYGGTLEIMSYTQPKNWTTYQSILLCYNVNYRYAWITYQHLPKFMMEAALWPPKDKPNAWDTIRYKRKDPNVDGFFFYVGYRKYYTGSEFNWDKETLLTNFVTMCRWFTFKYQLFWQKNKNARSIWRHFLQLEDFEATFHMEDVDDESMLYAEDFFKKTGWNYMSMLCLKAGAALLKKPKEDTVSVTLTTEVDEFQVEQYGANTGYINLRNLDENYEIAMIALRRYLCNDTKHRYVIASYEINSSEANHTINTVIDSNTIHAIVPVGHCLGSKYDTLTHKYVLQYVFGMDINPRVHYLYPTNQYEDMDTYMPNWTDIEYEWYDHFTDDDKETFGIDTEYDTWYESQPENPPADYDEGEPLPDSDDSWDEDADEDEEDEDWDMDDLEEDECPDDEKE